MKSAMQNQPSGPSVADALRMSHLTQDKKEVDQAFSEARSFEADSPAPEEDEFPAKMCQEEYAFDFEFASARGKKYQGAFTNRVLTVGQKIKVDVVRARRMVGVSRDMMTDSIVGMLFMVSWLEESLTIRPKWADDLMAIHDEEVIEAVFSHAANHERCFHRRKANPDQG